MKKLSYCRASLYFVIALFLIACGGGGGSSSPTPPPSGGGGLPAGDTYTINYISPDSVIITFGDNSISFGLISPVNNPADVDYIQGRGNAAGWTTASKAKGFLMQDATGRFLAEISNMPKTDKGNFVVVMKDGSEIWLNGGIYKVLLNGKSSPNAYFDGASGQFNYSM